MRHLHALKTGTNFTPLQHHFVAQPSVDKLDLTAPGITNHGIEKDFHGKLQAAGSAGAGAAKEFEGLTTHTLYGLTDVLTGQIGK